MARPRRGAEAPSVRPAQAHHQAVARHLPRLQRRHLSRRSSCTRSWPTWPATASPRRSPGSSSASGPIKALLDPYNPTGSTAHVRFNTSKADRWETELAAAARSTGSSSTATGRPSSAAWPSRTRRSAPTSRTTTSALKCPYRYGSETRKYLPDFIVLVDDGHGPDDLLAPRRRDQGLPARGCEGEEIHDGDLLGARREPPRHLWPLGLRRVHRGLSDRGRLQGQGRERVQQDDRSPPRRNRQTGKN